MSILITLALLPFAFFTVIALLYFLVLLVVALFKPDEKPATVTNVAPTLTSAQLFIGYSIMVGCCLLVIVLIRIIAHS